jgi:hypothetical protein
MKKAVTVATQRLTYIAIISFSEWRIESYPSKMAVGYTYVPIITI